MDLKENFQKILSINKQHCVDRKEWTPQWENYPVIMFKKLMS